MMLMPVIFAVLAALSGAVIAVVFSVRAASRKQLPTSPPTIEALQVAKQLEALDQRLAGGHLSQADYAAQRSQLLGLPAPEQR
jgi:hypothetical protein